GIDLIIQCDIDEIAPNGALPIASAARGSAAIEAHHDIAVVRIPLRDEIPSGLRPDFLEMRSRINFKQDGISLSLLEIAWPHDHAFVFALALDAGEFENRQGWWLLSHAWQRANRLACRLAHFPAEPPIQHVESMQPARRSVREFSRVHARTLRQRGTLSIRQ